MSTRVSGLVLLVLFSCCNIVLAQNWVFDAREIGLGAPGGTDNISTESIDPLHRHTTVVLPFGLIQVLHDWEIYDSSSSQFDPVRAAESAISPFHFIIGRRTQASPETLFASDVRSAALARDLGKYRGFAPVTGRLAENVASPIGHTFSIGKAGQSVTHGVFVGAGPYLSIETAGAIDQSLVDVFSTGAAIRNGEFAITDTAEAQAALAVTVGYRARLPFPARAKGRSSRGGLFVGANYNYLRGLLYEKDDLVMRLGTDNAGLVTDSSNIFVHHRHASDGTGFAVDVGLTAVADHWAIGFGARGVLNRIDWNAVTLTTYSLSSLTSGNSELALSTGASRDDRVVLPVDYRGTVDYTSERWSAKMGIGHGFAGAVAHAGAERRFGQVAMRGGANYRFNAWNPTAGVGIDIGSHVTFDLAAFGTTANIERTRQLGIAVSLRFYHSNQ
jgi:hypothetical protein